MSAPARRETIPHLPWTPTSSQPGQNKTFGMHMLLDLRDCTNPIREDTLTGWVRDLVETIGMAAYGPPLVQRFGLAQPHTAGWTLVQLIETSNITAHEMPQTRGLAVDVFSCRSFNPDDASWVCRSWFGGWVAQASVFQRG